MLALIPVLFRIQCLFPPFDLVTEHLLQRNASFGVFLMVCPSAIIQPIICGKDGRDGATKQKYYR